MMKTRNQVVLAPISIIVLLSLSVIIFNTICNGHIHKIKNGAILFHAHPIDKHGAKEPIKAHDHNQLELLLYDLITQLLEYGLAILSVFLFALAITFMNSGQFRDIFFNKFVFIPQLRAPPKNSFKIITFGNSKANAKQLYHNNFISYFI